MNQALAAVHAEDRLSPARIGVHPFGARSRGEVRVHDAPALRAMTHRRIAATVVHVLARGLSGAPHPARPLVVALGMEPGREWSAIRNVARETLTAWPQRGHLGFIELDSAPSRYASGVWQCGHGRKRPIIETSLPAALRVGANRAKAETRAGAAERGTSSASAHSERYSSAAQPSNEPIGRRPARWSQWALNPPRRLHSASPRTRSDSRRGSPPPACPRRRGSRRWSDRRRRRSASRATSLPPRRAW